MQPNRLRHLAASCAIGLSVLAAPSQAAAKQSAQEREGLFVRALDSATIVVKRHGRESTFELLGIEPTPRLGRTPKIEKLVHDILTTVLRGRTLIARADDQAPFEVDHGTYSGYVYLEDGGCLNEVVLRQGLASLDSSHPFSRLEAFAAIEKQADERRQAEELQHTGVQPADSDHSSSGALQCLPEGIPYAGTCGVSNPVSIPESRVQPVYPLEARFEKVQGQVVLQAVVTTDGYVTQIAPIKFCDERLSKAAIDAVSQWRYKPALKDGQPVAAYFTIVVSFELQAKD